MRATVVCWAGLSLVLAGAALPLAARDSPLPPPDRAPHLVLEHQRPNAPIQALAFAPNSTTLYAAGFDKQVRRYEFVNGAFKPTGTFRVPIGPGVAGVVNALAVSPDEKWVAVAGRAPIRGESWAGPVDGLFVADKSRLSPDQRRDAGVVYLFDPSKPDNGKVIRGPESEVWALAFANPAPADGPVLITVGKEWDADREFGAVRAFGVTDGQAKELAARKDLPAFSITPGIAAWATGATKDGLSVSVAAWTSTDTQAGKLLLWENVGTKTEKSKWLTDAAYNFTLAVRFDKAGGVSELLTGGLDAQKRAGRLTVREPSGAEKKRVGLPANADTEVAFPVGLAALDGPGTGTATAVLARVVGKDGGTVRTRHELRILSATGARTIELPGLAHRPVLTASPDGRFVAVAGFADESVKVYEAAALAAGKREQRELEGKVGGFAQVAFLAGEKLWLGRGADSPEKGGTVLDLAPGARVAIPRGAGEGLKLDAPGGARPELHNPSNLNNERSRVTVAVDGVERTVVLPKGARATAAAFLPGRPAWDADLGPLLAVASFYDDSRTPLVTLYDPATGKALLQLGGPALRVHDLAFSGTRPLLAGAGDDGTVAVWSLKNAALAVHEIEGLHVDDRGGKVVVASIRPGSPADGKLKEGDEIESVADAEGVQKPVTARLDFEFAVRRLKVGQNAQLKVKGVAAVVAVPVGIAVGFRHPLVNLWVDPVAKDGKHDWVGWAPSGPYDTNGPAAESRIGWLTATGIPERPVSYAPASEYRELYYKRDSIRQLLATGEFKPREPRPPRLTAEFAPRAESTDGVRLVREKPETLTVSLSDPDSVLDPERLSLRWRIRGPGGATEWGESQPFPAARAAVPLGKYAWTSGDYLVHLQLFRTGPAPAADALVAELTEPINYRPPEPPPQLVVKLDGAVRPRGVEYTTENEEVEVAVTVEIKTNPKGARVTLSWTGGGDPVEFHRNEDGTFAPRKVKIPAGSAVAVLVTATDLGGDMQSSSVDARVRRLEKMRPPPPSVELRIDTPYDLRTAPAQPFVVAERTVTVTATAIGTKAHPVTELEWRIGGTVERGELDPKSGSQTRTLTVPRDKSLDVRVRAKAQGTEDGFDCAVIRYDGLPGVSIAVPPARVTAAELNLSGAVERTSARPFRLNVRVTGSRTGLVREFEVPLDPTRTEWAAGVRLFPGENRIGYTIGYDGDRKRSPGTELAEVLYVRPPIVVGAEKLVVGTGAVGTLSLVVHSPPDLPPKQLWVNGAPVAFRTSAKPTRVLGVALWPLTAEGVAVRPGADRLKPVEVVVRNAESESARVSAEVSGRKDEVKVPPPTIRLVHKGGAIAPDSQLPPVGDRSFEFDLVVASETRLTKVEVWHQGDLVPEVEIAEVVARPGGTFVLTVRPQLRLRPGPENRVRVVASNGGTCAEVAFLVSYTPPPVRVVFDSIREPAGALIPVPDSGELPRVAGSWIDLSGHMEWDFDDDPIATANLEVVFIANGVAHVPVSVDQLARKDHKPRKRTFSGRVYLNALDPNPKAPGVTNVRAELRAGRRAVAVPQNALGRARITVTSTAPLRKQRLHVLVLGLEVPESQRPQLSAKVIEAVGGTVPEGAPKFNNVTPFDRDGFESAHLYPPRLGYIKTGDLNALLKSVHDKIETRYTNPKSTNPNDNWVNDVIVIYYQGADGVDDTVGWFLHSGPTFSGAAGKDMTKALRLDDLPPGPGLTLGVFNLVGGKYEGNDLAVPLAYMRCAFTDRDALVELLPRIATVIKAEGTTFRGLKELVTKRLLESPASRNKLAEVSLAGREEALNRVLSVPK